MKRFFVFGILILLAAFVGSAFITYTPGCQNVTPQEVERYDAKAKAILALFRAVVATQPEGPRRTELLRVIDSVTTYEQFAAAIALLSAEGVTPIPTTQPAK